MPPKYSTQPSVLRVCSSGGATVERERCHKNRSSQYICRRCQLAGTKSVRGRRRRDVSRRRYVLKWMLSLFFLGVAIGGIAVPVFWMDILTLHSISQLGRNIETPIDTRGGTLLNPEKRARVNEGSTQTGVPPKTDAR